MDITEQVYHPISTDVITHQKCGNMHRIILNIGDTERESEWMHHTEIAMIDYYEANWDGLIGFPFKD